MNAKGKLQAKNSGTEKAARYICLEANGTLGDAVHEAPVTVQATAGQVVAARAKMMTMKKPGWQIRAHQHLIGTAQIEGTACETSNGLDLFMASGLTSQLGYGSELWSIVAARELIHNALGTRESKGISREIVVTLGPKSAALVPPKPARLFEGISKERPWRS